MSTSSQDFLQRHRLSVDEYHRMASTGILPEDSLIAPHRTPAQPLAAL